eukprot:3931823-Rhodomonas_salina.1
MDRRADCGGSQGVRAQRHDGEAEETGAGASAGHAGVSVRLEDGRAADPRGQVHRDLGAAPIRARPGSRGSIRVGARGFELGRQADVGMRCSGVRTLLSEKSVQAGCGRAGRAAVAARPGSVLHPHRALSASLGGARV